MVDKNAWGEYLWHTIHFVALGYPKNPSEKDKTNYKLFYENLKNVIPCEECSKHYEKNLKEINVKNFLETKEKLFEWTVLIHNQVNKLLNRSEWSVKKAYSFYTSPFFNLRNSTKCFNNTYILIIIILLCIIGYMIYKNK